MSLFQLIFEQGSYPAPNLQKSGGKLRLQSECYEHSHPKIRANVMLRFNASTGFFSVGI